MSDQSIYGDFIMAAATDDFFRWYTNWEMPAFADGNVEAPTGWFAVCKPDAMDLAQYASESGEATSRLAAYLKNSSNYYLVQIDNLGFVYTVSYEGLDGRRPDYEQRRRALADFNRLSRMYTAWEVAEHLARYEP